MQAEGIQSLCKVAVDSSAFLSLVSDKANNSYKERRKVEITAKGCFMLVRGQTTECCVLVSVNFEA